jgi:hypothetical protein
METIINAANTKNDFLILLFDNLINFKLIYHFPVRSALQIINQTGKLTNKKWFEAKSINDILKMS